MTVNLYTFVGMYDRTLDVTQHLLEKGAAHLVEKGEDPESLLDMRLTDDMNPLRFQLTVVCNFTRNWLARAADQPLQEAIESTLDLDGFRAAIIEAKAYLATLEASTFEGRDDVELKVTLGNGMEQTLSVAQWLTGFATTNIYFHMSTAYGILRSQGVPLGKLDLFPGNL